MSDASTVTAVAVVLIFVGILMTLYQMVFVPKTLRHERKADFGPKGISLTTNFPGLVILGFGVIVLLVGPRLFG